MNCYSVRKQQNSAKPEFKSTVSKSAYKKETLRKIKEKAYIKRKVQNQLEIELSKSTKRIEALEDLVNGYLNGTSRRDSIVTNRLSHTENTCQMYIDENPIKNLYRMKSNKTQPLTKAERIEIAKQKFEYFLTTVSFHGFHRIAQTSRLVVKLYWALLIFASVGALIFVVSRAATDFYNHDVITNIKRVSPNVTTFPAITVCMLKLGIARIQQTKPDGNLSVPIDEWEYEPDMAVYNLSIRNFIKDVRFHNQALNETDLEFFDLMSFNEHDSNCVRFNGGTRTQFQEVDKTMLDGLSFSFDHLYTEVLSENLSYTYSKYLDKKFFYVYITDNFVNSYLDVKPILVSTATDIKISTTKTDIEEKLGYPYNDCTDTVDYSYRQVNCIEICINQQFKDQYNCSVESYYKFSDLVPCVNVSGIEKETLIRRFYIECEFECPLECLTIKYSTQVRLDEKLYLRDNYSNISFVLTDHSSLQITQIPKMGYYDLIANIGGSGGLFVGISFLSFFEILEFILDLCLCLFLGLNTSSLTTTYSYYG